MTIMPKVARHRHQSFFEDDDPLSRAMAPPKDETPQEKEARLRAEKAARLKSDAIDEELNRQRLAEKKVQCIRLLLLGMSSRISSMHALLFSLLSPPNRYRHHIQRPERIRSVSPSFFYRIDHAHIYPLSTGKSTTLKSALPSYHYSPALELTVTSPPQISS